MRLTDALNNWNQRVTFGNKLQRLGLSEKTEISEDNFYYVTMIMKDYAPLEDILRLGEDEDFLALRGTDIAKHVKRAALYLEDNGVETFPIMQMPYPHETIIGKYLVRKRDEKRILELYDYETAQNYRRTQKPVMAKDVYFERFERQINGLPAKMQFFLRGYVGSSVTKRKCNAVGLFLDFVGKNGDVDTENLDWMTRITDSGAYTAAERRTLLRMVTKYVEMTKECKIHVERTEKKLEPINVMQREKMLLFEHLVFDDAIAAETDRWKKAEKSREVANTWLVHCLHFTTAMRLGGIIKMRRPLCYVDADADKIAAGAFGIDDAERYCIDIEKQYRYLQIKPPKTEKNPRAPGQVFIIAEPYRFVIGKLLCLCEMHYRKKNCDGAFLSAARSDVPIMSDLYTSQVVLCMDGRRFQSRALSKAYMDLMECIVDEKNGDGYGHLINAILRSHVAGAMDYAKMIDSYLSGKMDRLDTQAAFLELFARGTMSCISVEIVKALAGEDTWKKLDVQAQTSLLNVIHNTKLEIEQLAKLNDTIAAEIDKKKQLVIARLMAGGNDWKETAKQILKGIGNGEAACKDENCNCSLIAIGKPCQYPAKLTCIGCQHEMYTRSFLVDLALEIKKNRESYDNARTDAERRKYRLYYSQILKPLIDEFCHLLKEHYAVDYKRLVANAVTGKGELYES